MGLVVWHAAMTVLILVIPIIIIYFNNGVKKKPLSSLINQDELIFFLKLHVILMKIRFSPLSISMLVEMELEGFLEVTKNLISIIANQYGTASEEDSG